ncbi:MAG: hypothetical protein LBJ13_00035, partial [Puniceicoccales bacterium]|nr:hypothetical protein [Puniceicoccales bacterium]
ATACADPEHIPQKNLSENERGKYFRENILTIFGFPQNQKVKGGSSRRVKSPPITAHADLGRIFQKNSPINFTLKYAPSKDGKT